MKERFHTTDKSGSQVLWTSSDGSLTTATSPGPRERYALSDVVSVKSPKPWNSRNINPHSYNKITYWNGALKSFISGHSAAYAYTFASTRYGIYSSVSNFYVPRPSFSYNTSAASDSALSKLLSKVRGEHANLAVDLAEGRETLRMLKNIVRFRKLFTEFMTSIVKSRGYRKIRKGPTQGQRRLDYINGKWLEYRYGWMPFLSSIWSIADALLKKRVLKETFLKARSGTYQEGTFLFGTNDPYDPGVKYHCQGSHRCEIGAFFELPTGFDISDWTSMNPLGVAYELITLSFVFEWLVGVGSYLENIENYQLYKSRFRGGYILDSYREVRYLTFQFSKDYPKLYWPNGQYQEGLWHDSASQFCTGQWVNYNRVVLLSLPTPLGPRVKVNLNSKRLLDSAALIGQYVRKFR